MTIPFIGKLKIDGVETYIDANSLTYKLGLPEKTTNVLVNGSSTKTTTIPDFTNARSTVDFSIRINADEGKVNPINLFYDLKSKEDTEITLLPENGSGGFIKSADCLAVDTCRAAVGGCAGIPCRAARSFMVVVVDATAVCPCANVWPATGMAVGCPVVGMAIGSCSISEKPSFILSSLLKYLYNCARMSIRSISIRDLTSIIIILYTSFYFLKYLYI